MSHANWNQRPKSRRKAKPREPRRQKAVSPIKRLADAPGEPECWICGELDEHRQSQVLVYKRVAGATGASAFLIDRGIVGLKDAWAILPLDRSQFDEVLADCRAQGISTRRVPIEEARSLVAGGLRFAHEHGMRLPKEWTKAAQLLGGVGEWQSADVSKFVREFVGHPEDLRQRLIGSSLETFLARNDIAFTFSDDAPYMDQQTGRYTDWPDEDDELDWEEIEQLANDIPTQELDAMLEQFTIPAGRLAETTAAWLQLRGALPSAELMMAWRSILLSRLLSVTAMPDASDAEIADFANNLLQGMTSHGKVSLADEYHRAVGQALEHLESNPLLIRPVIEPIVDIRPGS